jgi:hypothetical protein
VARGEVYLSPAIADVVVSEIVAEPEEPAPLILRTKLHPPPSTGEMVPRTRLLGRWDELTARPLTLVSCPAGYGKSTLACQWLERADASTAWLSVDREDNDLRVFVTGLVAAIQTAHPEVCGETAALLDAGRLPAPATLARHLLNDLDEIRSPLVLVLDDYHRIESTAVHELLAMILDHPPRDVHLILLTRRDPPLPIGRLRGRNQVTEIGVRDIRFSRVETAHFLEGALGFSIDEPSARAVHERLEGWPAGLRLLSRSIRQPEELDQFLAAPEGGIAALLDYLMDEVLAHQPPDMAGLMLEASLLDRFCPSLCEALREPGSGDRVSGRDFLTVSVRRTSSWSRSTRRTGGFGSITCSRTSSDLTWRGVGRRRRSRSCMIGPPSGSRGRATSRRPSGTRWRPGMWTGPRISSRASGTICSTETGGTCWRSGCPPSRRTWSRQRAELLLAQAWVSQFRFDLAETLGAVDRADELLPADDPLKAEVASSAAGCATWNVMRPPVSSTLALPRAGSGSGEERSGRRRSSATAWPGRWWESPTRRFGGSARGSTARTRLEAPRAPGSRRPSPSSI